MCDGTGACDKYPAGTVCKEMGCTGSTLTSAFRCDGSRHLRVDARPVVRAVQLRDRRPLPHHLHRRRRLHGAQQLPQRQLRQEADRRRVRRRPRVQLQLLRAGRLLRHRLHRHLPVVRGSEQRRHVHQRPRRQPIRWASAPTRAPATCGSDGMCDGKAACRLYASGTQCIVAGLHGRHRHPARPLRRRRHVRPRHRSRAAIRTPAAPPARAGRRAPPAPTARTATSATGRSAARRSTASTAPPATECASGSCQQGVCCAGACTGICTSCALAGSRGACTRDPRQHRSAEPVRRLGRVQLRHRRLMQRRRRLPAVSARPRLRHADRAPDRR